MANTTRFSAAQGGTGYPIAKVVSACRVTGAGYAPAKAAWVWNTTSSAWQMVYSTPTVTGSNCSGSTSGYVASGTVVSGTPGASIGGTTSGNYSYSWAFISGDSGVVPSSSSILNPTFSATVTSGSPRSAVYKLTLTDTTTGATTTLQISISLTWTNLWVPFNQEFNTAGSSSVSIPSGATSVKVYVAGAGGGGGGSFYDSPTGEFWGGQGGGSGGWNSGTYSITSGNWGQTISYTVGASASQYPAVAGSSSFSGSVTGGGLSATGGTGGVGGKQPLVGGAAGSPSGVAGTGGGDGNAGVGGINAFGRGNGADGQLDTTGGGNGADGAVRFEWS